MRGRKTRNMRIYGPLFSANTSGATDKNISEFIRRRAYQLFEGRGRQPGHELEDWLKAEQEIKARYGSDSSAAKD